MSSLPPSRASGRFADPTDEAVSRFSALCSSMKVYKRVADNVNKQVMILYGVPETTSEEIFRAMDELCVPINDASRTLQFLVERSIIRNCLSHKVIATSLDTLSHRVLQFVNKYFPSRKTAGYNDRHEKEEKAVYLDRIREDIGYFREMYEAERQPDITDLKRSQRDYLRSITIEKLVLELGVPALSSLKIAMKAELASNYSLSGGVCRRYGRLLLQMDFVLQMESSSLQTKDLSSGLALLGELCDSTESPIQAFAADYFGRRVHILYPPLMFLANDFSFYNDELQQHASKLLHLQHPNIVPVLGTYQIRNVFGILSYDIHEPVMGLVVPNTWHIYEYLHQHPDTDRLKLLLDIANGLAYLHKNNVHLPTFGASRSSLICNMKLIVVNEEGHAAIAGLPEIALWSASVSVLGQDIINGNRNKSKDMELIALMMLKLVSYRHPHQLRCNFDNLDACRHPSHIRTTLSRSFSAALSQWSPGLNIELNELFSHCISGDMTAQKQTVTARALAEALQKLLDARDSLTFMKDLTAEIVPSSLRLVCARGGFGEVSRAKLNDGAEVALKSLAVTAVMPKWRQNKRFQREALIWKELNHSNVLRLLGKAEQPGLSSICLVSPWMKNGTCIDYMRANKGVRSMPMMIGVARGLEYLHSRRVVHGDLRSERSILFGVSTCDNYLILQPNILVSDRGTPLLCDFGLAIIVEGITKIPVSSAFLNCGNPCWMAPELFTGTDTSSERSDIWALAMVMFEIVTLRTPFSEYPSHARVIVEVSKGHRPQKPGEDALERGFTEPLWELMQECWNLDQRSRPSAKKALKQLERMDPDRLTMVLDDTD